MADERPVQGVAFDLGFHIFKSDGTVIPDPGGLAARVVSAIHASGADADNSPTVVDSVGGACTLRLSTTEMTSRVQVLVTSTDSGAVPFSCTLYPDPNPALLAADITAAVWDEYVPSVPTETYGEMLADMDAELDETHEAAVTNRYRAAVWLDTENGVDGSGVWATDVGVYGTPTAPALTLAYALDLADHLKLKALNVSSDSAIVLDRAMNDWTITTKSSIDLGGQDISDSSIVGAYISGISSGDGAEFVRCALTDATIGPCVMFQCGFDGTLKLLGPGSYHMMQCFSFIPGLSTPVLDFNNQVNAYVGMRLYSGGIDVRKTVSTSRLSLEGNGQLKIGADCIGGTFAVRGAFTVTDNVAGGWSGTWSDAARLDVAHVADHVWAAADAVLLAKQATLLTVKATVEAIGAAEVTVTSPVVDSGDVTLYSGDDYPSDLARSIAFSVADAGHVLGLDAVSATVSLVASEVTWVATSVTSVTAGYAVVFEPDHDDTAALTAESQTYELMAALSGSEVVTLATGTLYAI